MLLDRVVKRRDLIARSAGLAAAWPLAASAQAPRVPTVGFLEMQSPQGSWEPYVDAFRRGLRETGFVEGQNVAIEYRWAGNQADRMPALAADLVRRQVAVIAATNTSASQAAQAATTVIPIVFQFGGDPVSAGLVTSFNRPGGNITGFSNMTSGLTAKRLGLLRELVPNVATIAVLQSSVSSNFATVRRELEEAGRILGVQLIFFNVSNDNEIDAAFPALVQQGAGALLLTDGTIFNNRRDELIVLAAYHRIPASIRFQNLPPQAAS
jgi:putative ABC transport system substrate-binding protein